MMSNNVGQYNDNLGVLINCKPDQPRRKAANLNIHPSVFISVIYSCEICMQSFVLLDNAFGFLLPQISATKSEYAARRTH